MTVVLSAEAGPKVGSAVRRRGAIGAVQALSYGGLARLLFVGAMLGMMTNGLSIAVAGLPLSLERLIGLSIIVLLVVVLIGGRQSYPGQRICYLWLSWNAVLLVSALFTSDPLRHLPAFLIALIPTATFWLIARYQFDHRFVGRITNRLLWANGLFGTALLGLRVLHVSPELFYDNLGRLKNLVLEANLYGSAIGFLLFVALARTRASWQSLIMLGLVLLTFLASGSRMPYLAFGVCMPLYGILRSMATGRGINQSVIFPIWLAALIGMLALGFWTKIEEIYVKNLSHEGTYSVRTYLMNIAFQRFQSKPVIGNGPGDFGFQSISILKQYGATDVQALWVPNMTVAILHDSGLVGILLYALAMVAILVTGLKTVLRGSVEHAAYLTAFVFVLLCSQASTVHLNIIFGIAAGLVMLPPVVRRVVHPTPYGVIPAGARFPALSPIGAD